MIERQLFLSHRMSVFILIENGLEWRSSALLSGFSIIFCCCYSVAGTVGIACFFIVFYKAKTST